MMDIFDRKKVLIELGTKEEDIDQLLTYNTNNFKYDVHMEQKWQEASKDEAFVDTWMEYADKAENENVFDVLKEHFPQLNFPIADGISKTDYYRNATLKGVYSEQIDSASGLILNKPEELRLYLYPTLAGRIPVIYTDIRKDFKTLVRALSMRNEPIEIPDSTGAFFVKGFNNWNRIRKYRANWENNSGMPVGEAQWREEFKRLIPQKHLYQDKFLILSGGFYSGVCAEAMGFSKDEWKKISLVIRREHECTHYFTYRIYGSSRNNLLDEIIADFMGIVEACGKFNAEWFLKFMGLENFPKYRAGGRLQNYRSKKLVSDEVWNVIRKLVWLAAYKLEKFNRHISMNNIKESKLNVLKQLCSMTIEEMAVL